MTWVCWETLEATQSSLLDFIRLQPSLPVTLANLEARVRSFWSTAGVSYPQVSPSHPPMPSELLLGGKVHHSSTLWRVILVSVVTAGIPLSAPQSMTQLLLPCHIMPLRRQLHCPRPSQKSKQSCPSCFTATSFTGVTQVWWRSVGQSVIPWHSGGSRALFFRPHAVALRP